jgi:hypothetical protein
MGLENPATNLAHDALAIAPPLAAAEERRPKLVDVAEADV